MMGIELEEARRGQAMRLKRHAVLLGTALVAISLVGCVQPYPIPSPSPIPTPTPADDKGGVVFLISDAAADLSAVSRAELTVNSVQARAQGGAWVALSSTTQTYDLVKLKVENSTQLLAEAALNAGDYDRVKIDVSQIVVVDNNGTNQCTMPNNTLEMDANFEIQSGSTAAVELDFILDESLYVASDGRYVFAPTVQLETRNEADVQIKSDDEVEVSGGQVVTNVKLGMSLEGEMGIGLGIDLGSILNIDSSGKITIGMGGG